MQTFTVGELAARIQRPDEDLDVVIRRLKNWQREGLIKAAGERNPGTGLAITYDDDALIDAAFLSVLTEAVGVPAVRGKAFKVGLPPEQLKALKKVYDRKSLTRKRAPDAGFCVLSMSADGRAEFGHSKSEYLAKHLAGSPHDAHIVIDLKKFQRRLGV